MGGRFGQVGFGNEMAAVGWRRVVDRFLDYGQKLVTNHLFVHHLY